VVATVMQAMIGYRITGF